MGSLISAESKAAQDLRDVRYCEVILISLQPLKLAFELDVYNTIGFSECPVESWQQLSAQQIADDFDVTQVSMNGPRYWTLDAITSTRDESKAPVAIFGDLQMKQVAVLELGLLTVLFNEPYAEVEVARDTIWHYRSGALVYELESPEGYRYWMQSYSQIVDPELTLEDLGKLEQKIALPKGWAYRVVRLDNDVDLAADGMATVIQDSLKNTYQRLP